MKFKFLPHTADIKFQAFGNNLEQCFANAGYALTNIITKDKIKPAQKKTIRVKGKDRGSLLYNFLEEFLYIFEVGGFLAGKIENIKIKSLTKSKKPLRFDMELTAELLGDDSKNYEAETHIKAVTYNDMFVKHDSKTKKFICQVVVDV